MMIQSIKLNEITKSETFEVRKGLNSSYLSIIRALVMLVLGLPNLSVKLVVR